MKDAQNTPAATVNEADAEDQEPTPSVPAGEPEAPVAPDSPAADPSAEPSTDAEDEPSTDPGAEPSTEPETGPAVDLGEGRDGSADDHGAKLMDDLAELTARAQKADEYLSLAQRTKADFENYRRRAAREAGAAQERGVIRLAKELLPAVDNLDRALESVAASTDGSDLLAGIKLVHAEVLAALARVGVEPFDPAGQAFDPSSQEAVAQQPVDGAEPGTVAEVFQRGYRLGETVIRPARVLVAG
jgi:molecular chaperone GrpE